MNLNFHEIRRLNSKSIFNRRCLWRCYRCCSVLFCWLGSERLPALSTICLFGCLACVWAFVCFVLVSLNFCAVHLVVIVCAGDFRLLFKLLFTFRNIVKYADSRSSLSCNQNIQEDIPTALKVFLCFETKRNDKNRSPTKTCTRRASNIRGRTGYNV